MGAHGMEHRHLKQGDVGERKTRFMIGSKALVIQQEFY